MRWALRLVALAILAVIFYQIWIIAHIWYWRDHNPSSSAFMDSQRSVLQAKPGTVIRHRWVAYSEISPHLKRALIAAEDAKFAEHDGFDWQSIQKAYEKNRKKGRIVAGGSTITQQLAKNLFLSAEKTPGRKIQEAVITLMLEKLLTKRRILELYINIIEWGEGIFGAEAAAQHYFATSAKNLTREQSAKLAAMTPRPRYYETRVTSLGLERRTHIILARMPAAQVPQ